MRKHMLALALCLALPWGTVLAAAGPEDPLVSLSYLRDRFLPRAEEALSDIAAQVLAERAAREGPGVQLIRLSAGQTVRVEAGQQYILLSGRARLEQTAGETLDVSTGTVAGETVKLFTRYVVCEDAAGVLTMIESDNLLSVTGELRLGGAPAPTPEPVPTPEPTPAPDEADAPESLPFRDVAEGSWYYADVAAAYRRGLVSGMAEDSFQPQGALTAAQCVKLAACMHQLWNEGAVTLENSAAGPWYRSYVDYAMEQGIMGAAFPDYDAEVTRREFLRLFYNALPESAYPVINTIADDRIPDVALDGADGTRTYRFYRAGILTGYADHSFGPDTTITRAEVATIMNRMFDPEARQRFTL